MQADLSTRAPGFDPELIDEPWWRRALAQGAGYYLPNIAFLAIPIAFTWGVLPPWRLVLLVAVALLVACTFVGSTLVAHWSLGRRWAWLVVTAALVGVMAFVADNVLVLSQFAIYVTAAAAALLPLWQSRLVVPLVSAAAAALAVAQNDLFALVMALTGGVLGLALAQGIDYQRTQRELSRERTRAAAMALASERQRISRDLHDILGHSLTTIAVKADLAGKLIGRDPEAAAAQIAELGALARQSLADVRTTVSGMRRVRLASEIATARNALESAGLACSVPSALPALDDHESEVLGYVVREAITNAMRHAEASACAIEVGERWVSVRDNGRGIAPDARRGGLAGLAQRVADAGGVLEVGPHPDGGTLVRAELPSREPVEVRGDS